MLDPRDHFENQDESAVGGTRVNRIVQTVFLLVIEDKSGG